MRHGQATVQTEPGNTGLTFSGGFPCAPPRDSSPAVARRRPARPKPQDRSICFGRTRLDLEANESEPLDRDLTVHVRGYRFTLSVLLKSPPTFFKITRSPGVFKSNCILTLFLALRPLAFLRMEPAIQHLVFCTLALRFNG